MMNFSDKGSGDVIVLIHGYMETAEVWENFADKLSQHFRTVSVDLPGHGLSALSDEINTMDSMAEAVIATLDSLEISKALFVGHSMGGYVALAALKLFPERVSGITLFNSHPFADSGIPGKQREGVVEKIFPAIRIFFKIFPSEFMYGNT